MEKPKTLKEAIAEVRGDGQDLIKPLIYTLPNGKKIYIARQDVDFIEKLRALPYQTKIQILHLTEEEMESYIAEKKKADNDYLIKLVKENWHWRETGDPADITAEVIEYKTGIKISPQEIIKKAKSKNKLPLKTIRTLINFYVGDRADIYVKEDQQ